MACSRFGRSKICNCFQAVIVLTIAFNFWGCQQAGDNGGDVFDPGCVNTVGWTNGHTHGCTVYEQDWCSNGVFWGLGAFHNYPEKNCCKCGKGGTPPQPATPKPPSQRPPTPEPQRPSAPTPGPGSSPCPSSPSDCLSGGYSSRQPARMSWDLAKGCWWETCVREVDVTAEKAAFIPHDYDRAQDLLLRIYDKVYPHGASIFRNATWSKGVNDCSSKFRYWFDTLDGMGSWKAFINAMPTALHETIHCMHGCHGKYMPGLTDDLLVYTKRSNNCANLWDENFENEFPRRNEVWSRFPSEIRSDSKGLYNIYFDPSQGSFSGQRIDGFLTETEAYLHDVPSGAWLNDGVGDTISVQPPIDANLLDNGNPYALAYWSYAGVLYLQRIKSHYPGTWDQMMEKSETPYAQIGRLFLAHHDRFNFLLSLYIDKNDVTMPFKQEKANLLRSEKVKVLKEDNVIEELREAHG